MSSHSSALPSAEQKYRRTSGWSSGPTMRSAIRRGRTAGNRSTGTLTRPKVSVPLQNARGLGAASRSSAMARLLALSFQAGLQSRDQRIGLLALCGLRETYDLARCFRRKQPFELLLIFVAKLVRVEAILERTDELLRKGDLALVGRAIRVRPHGRDFDDLLRIAHRVEQQIAAARLQRPDISLVAQHPVRDADRFALLQRFGEREVALVVAVGPQVIRAIEPALVDLARRDDLLDADEARRFRRERRLL